MKQRCFWLQEALAREASAPTGPLQAQGKLRADVAIIGGGYVGLWTALRLKQVDPACQVMVLEKDICGGGASGRNGGLVLSWWPKIASLEKIFGPGDAVAMAQDSAQAVQELGEFCRREQLHAHFRPSPRLWTATSSAQMGAWQSTLQTCQRLGKTPFTELDAKQTSARTGSQLHRAALLDPNAALVQPALLARGLRQAALRAGVLIFEQTPVLSFSRRNPLTVQTVGAQIRCQKLIIANNAWAAAIPELARSLVAVASDILLTAPASADLAGCGWVGGESITDSQMMITYSHVTAEGRIAFGKGGGGVALGGRIGPDFEQSARRSRAVETDFHRNYPSLRRLPITHRWSGPVDRSPNALPLIGSFKQNPNILYGVGWSGNGVGPSLIGAKILASLALGAQDRWSEYPLLNMDAGNFPPEPIRYLGAQVVRVAVARKESDERNEKLPPLWARHLARLAPQGLGNRALPTR